MSLTLKVHLKSDSSFASGRGVPGQLDNDVEHDAQGFPVIGAKRLAGLVADEGRELLELLPGTKKGLWTDRHDRLFGVPGSGLTGEGIAKIESAAIPVTVRHEFSGRSPKDVLETFTAIRRQTVIDDETGAPSRRLLRATRVVIRDLWFLAPVRFTTTPTEEDKAWLAACVAVLRRGGLRRNRGRGRLRCELLDTSGTAMAELMKPLLAHLEQ